MAKSAKNKVFYGWIIVACGILIMGFSFGIIMNGFSLFIKPIAEELGIERRFIALCHTIFDLTLMTISFLSGKIYSRVHFVKLMKISTIVLPIAYFAFSKSIMLWEFYILFVIMGICVSFLSTLPFSILVTNWFKEKRGLAMGLAFMGTGIGGMIFNAVGSRIIEKSSWRTLASLTPIAMAIFLIPATFFVVKEKPKNMNLQPYGALETNSENEEEIEDEDSGMSFEKARRSPEFVFLIILALLLGFTTAVLMVTVVTHISDLGFDNVYAANLMAVSCAAIALGKIEYGRLTDRTGVKKASIISILSASLGMIGFIFGSRRLFHLLIVFGNFLGAPIATVGYPILAQKVFGKKSYVKLNGLLNCANYTGVALASFIPNLIYDKTGTYQTAFIMCIFLCLVSVVLVVLIRPRYENT